MLPGPSGPRRPVDDATVALTGSRGVCHPLPLPHPASRASDALASSLVSVSVPFSSRFSRFVVSYFRVPRLPRVTPSRRATLLASERCRPGIADRGIVGKLPSFPATRFGPSVERRSRSTQFARSRAFRSALARKPLILSYRCRKSPAEYHNRVRPHVRNARSLCRKKDEASEAIERLAFSEEREEGESMINPRFIPKVC